MAYGVEITKQAGKEWKDLPATPQKRIGEAMRSLGDDPKPPGSKKLTNRDEWRIRVGDYRILYRIKASEELITVVHVAHRKDAY